MRIDKIMKDLKHFVKYVQNFCDAGLYSSLPLTLVISASDKVILLARKLNLKTTEKSIYFIINSKKDISNAKKHFDALINELLKLEKSKI
ncbi:MAG: hypothetical protein ACTSRZ_13240 [Promethearchaeota archaeon]